MRSREFAASHRSRQPAVHADVLPRDVAGIIFGATILAAFTALPSGLRTVAARTSENTYLLGNSSARSRVGCLASGARVWCAAIRLVHSRCAMRTTATRPASPKY